MSDSVSSNPYGEGFLLKNKKNENHKKKTLRNIRRLHLRFQKVIIITLIAFVYKNIRN